MTDIDAQFFADHPDRRLRIREPRDLESEAEFRSLGPHQSHRRRVIVSRVPENRHARRMAKATGVDFMRIPFLLFADETVEDTDEVLAPILQEIMQNAAAEYGIGR